VKRTPESVGGGVCNASSCPKIPFHYVPESPPCPLGGVMSVGYGGLIWF